ncbi:MAG: hypothetical protein QOG91_350 [Candidatus Parcubacteria bacterium]|jgi:hypothetical protein|nr:hypothetical protein [Candidatus Parcubacteria bacterium]
MDEERITYFAETDARNKRIKFGIKAKDRTRHVYAIGKTGMGKSTMLENMAVQDIQNGEGIAFIDPHGKTADLLLEYVPKERIRDVIYIAPFDIEYPISFNVLEEVDPDKRHLVVSGLMGTFKKIWLDAWSARMEYILTNTLLALLEAPNANLLGVNRMLSDKDYRREIVSHIQDPSVKNFWVKEFANYTERMAAEAVPAIQNKVGQFTANPLIRNMIGQPRSSFNLREAMDQRKIIIINLSKGRIGDENMKLLGGIIVTKIYLAAMSRADTPDRIARMLPNFYLYVDEFQNFANVSFADILSEARKYKLNLTIAHQYIEQMDELIRPAVFGNVGTMIVFRVGATDAEVLEKEFAPQFTIEDLVNLGFTQVYLKLMIDGLTSPPFSAVTLPPIPHPDTSYVKDIIAASREQFAKPRAGVEEQVIKFHEPTPRPTLSPALNKGSAPAAPKAERSPAPPPPLTPHTASVPVSAPAPAPAMGKVTATRPAAAPMPERPRVPSQSQPVSPKVISPPIMPQSAPRSEPAIKPPPQTEPRAIPAVPPLPPPPPRQPAAPAPVSRIPQAVREPEAPPAKPVSSSNLAVKPPQVGGEPRTDPKVQSPKNISDLKNALAAALSKTAASLPKPLAPPVLTPNKTPESPVPQKPETAEKIPKKSAEKPAEAPAEVPEDILKKVLKDG